MSSMLVDMVPFFMVILLMLLYIQYMPGHVLELLHMRLMLYLLISILIVISFRRQLTLAFKCRIHVLLHRKHLFLNHQNINYGRVRLKIPYNVFFNFLFIHYTSWFQFNTMVQHCDHMKYSWACLLLACLQGKFSVFYATPVYN